MYSHNEGDFYDSIIASISFHLFFLFFPFCGDIYKNTILFIYSQNFCRLKFFTNLQFILFSSNESWEQHFMEKKKKNEIKNENIDYWNVY